MSTLPVRRVAVSVAFLAVVCASAPARSAGDPPLAEGSLAVLDFSNKIAAHDLSAADARYFADTVRGEALKLFPKLRVMTRENLLVLLQSNGKDVASCEGECEVDTGRRIGADLIISGELLKIGTSFKLNLRLHETHGGRMLSGEIASGKSIDELDANTALAAQRLLAPLQQRDGAGAAANGAQPLIRDASPATPLVRDANAPAPTSSDTAAAPPSAQPASATAHRHLGFLFRADLGGSYLSTSEGSATVSGGAAAFGLEAGYALWEDTLLGLRLYASVAVNPGVSNGSQSAETSNTSLTSFAIGPVVTHYFMPLNLYVSGAIGVSTLSVTVNGTSSSASAGLGLRGAIGKEWWISDHWGIGVAAQLSYASNADTNATASTIAGGIALSATYN